MSYDDFAALASVSASSNYLMMPVSVHASVSWSNGRRKSQRWFFAPTFGTTERSPLLK